MSSSNVNHLSEPCIYERKSSFMKWIGKLFKCVETSSGRAVAAGGGGDQSQFIGDENMSSRRAPVDFGFSLSGKGTYDESCFKELSHPKCEVCHQYIPTNRHGLIDYRCHPFWSQKYCPSHEHDNTPRCYSCESLESRNTKYVLLGDGRSLCLECMESAIMDTGDCQSLYHAIRDYYEGMNLRIHQQNPMFLVERQAFNEAMEAEKHGFHHMPDTRGLCLSEKKTVTSIMKRPRMEHRGLVGLRTQPQKLTRTHEVAAILVLLLTGAILAHELMHGWLRLNGYHNLRPEVEEGLCQVLAHMWLESEVIIPTASRSMPSTSAASSSSSRWSYGSTNMPFNSAASSSSSRWSHGSTNIPSNSGALSSPTWSNGSTNIPSSSPTSSSWSTSKKGSKSSVENKLGKFFMHQIAHGAAPAYGEGYRAAMKAVNKYGLRATLDNIRFTGTFPY